MIRTEVHLVPGDLVAGTGRRLMVLVPAEGQSCRQWTKLLDRLKKDMPGTDWLLYDHRRNLWSTRTMNSLAGDLAAKINEIYSNHKPYQGITLIGHSLGAILLRKAYLMGAGHGSGDFDTGKKEWTTKVDRIILFSALNRGIDPDRVRWGPLPVGTLLRAALLVPLFRLRRDYTKGSSFLTELRISWIHHFREFGRSEAAAVGGGASLKSSEPVVIQLRGAKADFLHEEDSTDIEQFTRAKQELLQGVGHYDVYTLPTGQEDERYEFLRQQIVEADGVRTTGFTDSTIKHVLFLVHGIRASTSGWPARAEEIVNKSYTDAVAVRAGYRYFPALNFAIPFLRRKQIRWMQDQYAYRYARHPDAEFYFLGHSNGTYLLGRLLERVPSVRFKRVTLVGSVLPQTFHWEKHLGSRVGEYQNHRSAGDIPVALLCSFLRGYGVKDIGTAGFSGFVPGDKGKEIFYYKGGHGAALADEENLKRLIRSTLNGDPSIAYPVTPIEDPGMLAVWSRTAPLMAIPLALLVAVGLYEPATRIPLLVLMAVITLVLRVY